MSAGTDAFSFCWQQKRAPYINPRALKQIVDDRVKAMVVIPRWPNTEWWPLFSRIIISTQLGTSDLLQNGQPLLTDHLSCVNKIINQKSIIFSCFIYVFLIVIVF